MENSPTGTPVADSGLVTEPTTTPAEPVAAEQNQEAISNPTETVSESTPAEQTPQPQAEEQKQTPQKAEVETTDDGLAKFAKSQGFDPENLTDGERRALKLAHDNQKAYRTKANETKVAESTAGLGGDVTKDEIQAFQQEFRTYQAQRKAESFFKEDGRDDTLAPVMSEILEEKKAAYGPEYARVLSEDLTLLYDLAQVKRGAKPSVDAEAIRREERESINQKLTASTTAQHAQTNTLTGGKTKVTAEWIRNEYDPRNPEHLAIMQEAGYR